MSSFTPDFPDFATPVAVLDQAAELTNGLTNCNGTDLGPFDVSRYQTLVVRFQPPAALVPAGKRYVIQVTWRDLGFPVSTDTATFHSYVSYFNGSDSLFWVLPIRGQTATIECMGDTMDAVMAQVFASTRTPPPAPRLTRSNSPADQCIVSNSFGVVAAGATTAKVYVPPVARAIHLVASPRAAYLTLAIDGVVAEFGVMTAHRFTTTDALAGVNNGDELVVPSTGLEIAITNGDAAGHAVVCNVWDVS